jgi:hypothetical protein
LHCDSVETTGATRVATRGGYRSVRHLGIGRYVQMVGIPLRVWVDKQQLRGRKYMAGYVVGLLGRFVT